MPLDLGTLEYLREQMSLVEPITIKRMFGGAGFYARGYFFALIDDDTVYFKTDDSNRGDYLAMKSPPFVPFGEGHGNMDYHELPDVILDNPAKLRAWMEKSIAVAIRAKERKGGTREVKQNVGEPKQRVRASGALDKTGNLKKNAKGSAEKKSPTHKRKKAKRKTR